MKIEVFNDLTRKGVFSFTNDKTVVVGRQADADILLEGDDISRDHMHIIYKNNGIYVTDQGSTYGVFINEERIPPFKEVEFTTYFQIRVGPNFYLSLLSHEDENEISKPVKLSNQDRTQSFNAYKAKAVIPKAIAEKTAVTHKVPIKVIPASTGKGKAVVKKKVAKKESSSSSALLLLLVVAAAAAYWFFVAQGNH